MSLRLKLVAENLAVCRLGAEEPLPRWAQSPPFFCVTRTPDELSIVCAESVVPPEIRNEAGWRALAVAGPLVFDLVGIVASLATPLAAAGLPIFAISTFDTDYILVKAERLERAIAVLREAGHDVAGR